MASADRPQHFDTLEPVGRRWTPNRTPNSHNAEVGVVGHAVPLSYVHRNGILIV